MWQACSWFALKADAEKQPCAKPWAHRERVYSRQFATEALTLVAAGSVVGLGMANFTMKILTGLISKDMLNGMPFLRGLTLNAHVLIFAACLSLLAAFLFFDYTDPASRIF